MNAKISVIIPCYNAEKWLEECLKTVQNQTLMDIEIVCIDDKSTDKTLSLLKKIALNDERIKIIEKAQNEGAGPSRNEGIRCATGDFIAFMDPDDYYPSSDVLKELYEKAIYNDVDVCGGNIVGIDVYGNNLNISSTNFSSDCLRNYYDNQFAFGYTRFIYRRLFLSKNNIFFPHLLRFQDPPFFVKAMSTAKRYYSIHKDVYSYRISYKNIKWTEKKVIDTFMGIKYLLDLIRCLNLQKLYIDIFVEILFSETYYSIYKQQNHSIFLQNILFHIFSEANLELLDKSIKNKLTPFDKYIEILNRDSFLWDHFKSYFKKTLYTQENYKKVLKRIIKTNKTINVVFIVSENQKWTYQDLYDCFVKDKRFSPLILVSLLKAVHEKIDDTRNNLEENYNFFKSRGMNVKYCYVRNEYIPLKQFNPDLVFYEQPWELPEIYQPWNVSEYALTFFENYFYSGLFSIDADSLVSDFHKSLFKFFLPNE